MEYWKFYHFVFYPLHSRKWRMCYSSLEYIFQKFQLTHQYNYQHQVHYLKILSLRYASKTFKSDREIVLEAIKQDGSSLQFASEELQSDREIVLEAVIQNSLALEFASENLKADKEIISKAAINSREIYLFNKKDE